MKEQKNKKKEKKKEKRMVENKGEAQLHFETYLRFFL